MKRYKRYHKEVAYSYAFGVAATIELLFVKPERALEVVSHSRLREESAEKLRELCGKANVKVSVNDRFIEGLSQKESFLAVGIFEKYTEELDGVAAHIALVNPSDMGNLGTIMRTAAGFGVRDIAIIEPAADYFDPKAVRASMGAIFHCCLRRYAAFSDYADSMGERQYLPFILRGNTPLPSLSLDGSLPYTLIFGNEAAGLPAEFEDCDIFPKTVTIPHNGSIDSLNLPIAVGIALYAVSNIKY